MDATRAGKGCGSCKLLVKQVVEWAADGAVEEDPAASYYVPGIPLDKAAADGGHPETAACGPCPRCSTALAPGSAEDAKSKMGLASLLKMMLADQYIDERDARFINDRVHANIQRDGTFSVVPQMKGGVTSVQQLRRIADVAEKHNVPADQADRRAADRPAGHPQGGPPAGLGRPGHALRLRLRQELPHREDLCGQGLLPLRDRAIPPSWASRSSPGSRASSRRPS